MRNSMRGTSPILVTAALSVAALLSAAGLSMGNTLATTPTPPLADRVPVEMPTYIPIEDRDGNGTPDWQDELLKAGVAFSTSSPPAASSTDALSTIAVDVAQALYGGYLSLKQYGEYTPSRGEQLASSVVANIRAPIEFKPHTVDELLLRNDTSVESALAYRSDMRDATAPMISDEVPELDLFASFVETKDRSWLMRLADAATRYKDAETRMVAVETPKDAAPEHLRVINAVGSYASVIARLSVASSDAFEVAALIKTQSEAEKEMLNAFDALAKYYVRTITN